MGWADAKKKIWADRRARTQKMEEEPSAEQMLQRAMYEDDRERELLDLLKEAYELLPEKELKVKIRKVLSS